MNLPFVSICIPTYNNESTIDKCLFNIFQLDYPSDKFEVIIVDGGSTDKTLEICKKYNVNLQNNPYKVEEFGRVIGIEISKGEIISFIDADNYIFDNQFLKKMVTPFMENENIGMVQPKYYTYEKNDDIITKYIGLTSGDDPVAIYLGMYERFCYFKNKWTDSDVEIIKKNDLYEIVKFLDINDIPAIGSNGCFIKKDVLISIDYKPFIHTDIGYRILKKGYYFCVVDTGLVHKQNGSFITFMKKKNRRLQRNYDELKREYFQKINMRRATILVLKCLFFIPLLFDSIKGFIRKPSLVWLLHPFFVEITFFNVIFQSLLKVLKGKKIYG